MISRSLKALRNNCMLDNAAGVCRIITFSAWLAVVKEMLKKIIVTLTWDGVKHIWDTRFFWSLPKLEHSLVKYLANSNLACMEGLFSSWSLNDMLSVVSVISSKLYFVSLSPRTLLPGFFLLWNSLCRELHKQMKEIRDWPQECF